MGEYLHTGRCKSALIKTNNHLKGNFLYIKYIVSIIAYKQLGAQIFTLSDG